MTILFISAIIARKGEEDIGSAKKNALIVLHGPKQTLAFIRNGLLISSAPRPKKIPRDGAERGLGHYDRFSR